MEKKLRIRWFIEQDQTGDWEKTLSEKPYCVTVTRDKAFGRNLVMFKYSQVDSDFNEPLVRELRGLVLDEDTLEPVVVPFFKFGNYGESYVPDIDWKTAFVSQKLDGSLIKVVKIGSDLLVSTNGTIDAYKAPLPDQIGCPAKNFGELFEVALAAAQREDEEKARADGRAVRDWLQTPKQWLAEQLEEGKTYMFELTSPWNKVVVQWHDTRLNFIGVRDNSTLEESRFYGHPLAEKFNVPKLYPLGSFDACVAAAKELDISEEGYVVCDGRWNRCKIKSPVYVSVHHMRNNGVLSFARAIDIVKLNEVGEVSATIPEFKEHLDRVKADFDAFVASLEKAAADLDAWLASNGYKARRWLVENGGQNRKDAAIWITKNFQFPGLGFGILDGKVESVRSWVESTPSDKLAKILGYKEPKADGEKTES